jgi:hypothetical protein
MSRLALSQKNPNRLQVEGLEINASIVSVEILHALYALKRACWVNTQHGWQEGTEEQKHEFWKSDIPLADEAPRKIGEDHIMKRPRANKIDSLLAEAQVYRTGRGERTVLGGWRRIEVSDEPSNKENSSQNDQSENVDTVVESSTEGSGPELIYKGTKRACDAFERDEMRQIPSVPSVKPSLKKKRTKEPKKSRPQPNVNMDEYDVSSIHLEGEEEENLSIFDTCDDIREKIKALLQSSSMTRAAFMRLLCSAAFPTSKKKIQDRQLANFQGQDGPKKGCESNVFYAAYVYFEKLRVKNGEEKSEKRQDMEEIWDDEGVPRKMERGGYIVRQGSEVYEDEYGVVVTSRGGVIRDESISEKAARNFEMMVMSKMYSS